MPNLGSKVDFAESGSNSNIRSKLSGSDGSKFEDFFSFFCPLFIQWSERSFVSFFFYGRLMASTMPNKLSHEASAHLSAFSNTVCALWISSKQRRDTASLVFVKLLQMSSFLRE